MVNFQVLMFTPKYALDSDENFIATTNAISSTERLARGNGTLKVYGSRFLYTGKKLEPRLLWSESVFLVSAEIAN
jgi:hypothetical protein